MAPREQLSAHAYTLPTRRSKGIDVWRQSGTNKLGLILGIVALAVAFGAAPMPLTMNLEGPTQNATIYPNLLFAIPLTLLGALLLLYGAVTESDQSSDKPALE
jgi:peptidoglycan/LPS O-acetylase OafA/YrhL